MRTIEGNLLEAKEDIIAHQVNCQGKMNSGVAKQIREKYPAVYNSYMALYKQAPNSEETLKGFCQLIECRDKHMVANLFGQVDYGYDRKQYTDYIALQKALAELHIFAYANNLTVAIPYKMGCDRGGGDWNIVIDIIDEIFNNPKKPVQITAYKLIRKETPMENINRREIFKNDIVPLLNKLDKVCEQANIPYAYQFDLKDIEHDNKHYMATACNTMWSKEINHVFKTMCKVHDTPLP